MKDAKEILRLIFDCDIFIASYKEFWKGDFMKVFNKLVRDKIPEIIASKGEYAKTRILDNDEYKKELDKKLLEEVNEYMTDDNVEELADID